MPLVVDPLHFWTMRSHPHQLWPMPGTLIEEEGDDGDDGDDDDDEGHKLSEPLTGSTVKTPLLALSSSSSLLSHCSQSRSQNETSSIAQDPAASAQQPLRPLASKQKSESAVPGSRRMTLAASSAHPTSRMAATQGARARTDLAGSSAPPQGQTTSSHLVSSSPTTGRSYSDGVSPTLANLATEREANLRTPRPHEQQLQQQASSSRAELGFPPAAQLRLGESAADTLHDSTPQTRILQWQRERRDLSDATLYGNVDAAPSRKASMAESASYPHDSLGRSSATSSAFGGATSASEFGHGTRSPSDTGHEPHSSAMGSSSKKKRAIAPPEQLVVVRPPPSKQTNPLNLQIQLVTPQAAASANGRSSGEVSRDADASAGSTGMQGSQSASSLAQKIPRLSRAASTSSTRSGSSEASSAAMSSLSAGSTNRRVTPLYNLCFHNILPTTVTDAGTDQKVAKFSRRGIDIDGFGLIVPHEVISGAEEGTGAASVNSSGKRKSGVPAGVAQLGTSPSHDGSRPYTPSETSQARSTDSFAPHARPGSDSGHEPEGAKTEEPPTSFDAMSPAAKESNEANAGLGARFFRGFKRLNLSPAANVAQPGRTGTTDTGFSQPQSLLSKVAGAASKIRDSDSSIFSGRAGSIGGEPGDSADVHSTAGLQAAVPNAEIPQLVVGAGIRSDGTRRAIGYEWTVRKWSRRVDEDGEDASCSAPGRHHAGENPILNSVWKRFSLVNRMGGTDVHPPARDVVVRFEWSRQPLRKRSTASGSAMQRHSRSVTDGGVLSTKRRQMSETGREVPPPDSLHPPQSGSRPSSLYSINGSGGLGAPSMRGSMDRGSIAGSARSGDDCSRAGSDPEDSETMWSCHLVLGPTTRIPIGSMRPTPHHPKLVAQLTIPYPLPDLSQSALGADGAGLTREELKDIISVTSLFVIVREAFSGLAKRRKGDSVLRFGAAVAQR